LCVLFGSLVGEGQAAHTRLDAQHVVVDREQLLQGGHRRALQHDRHLGVVNAREVAGAGWLVLLGLQGEGVGVDTRVGGTGVVVEGLHLVEVLAVLLLEAVLAVQHHLEQVQGTHLHAGLCSGSRHGETLLNPVAVGVAGQDGEDGRASRASQVHDVRRTAQVWQHEVVRRGKGLHVGRHCHGCGARGEVPHVVQVGRRAEVRVGVAPDQLLHGVVEGQTDQLRAGIVGDRVATGVLHLLDQVLVALLGEAATLLGVQVDVVGPHLERVGRAEVLVVVGGQVEVQAHLVVLQGNQGQVQTGVAVEEEQQGQVHAVVHGGGRRGVHCGRHLAPGNLVRLVQEQLGVQAPPGLVVLVDTLATDGQLDRGDRALGHPVGVETNIVGGQHVRRGLQSHVHVADQVAVAGNGHGHAARGGRGTVGRLLDQLHREVGVALVHRLEEGHLGRTGQVHVLSAVSYELHKSTSHFTIRQENNSGVSGRARLLKTLCLYKVPMADHDNIPEDEEMNMDEDMDFDGGEDALVSLLTTDEGETITSVLDKLAGSTEAIAKHLEKQNVILVKILSALSAKPPAPTA